MIKGKTISKAPFVRYTSNFVLLDVEKGRASLARLFESNGYPCEGNSVRIPVTINGFITHRHGGDDGISIEFGIEPTNVKISGGR